VTTAESKTSTTDAALVYDAEHDGYRPPTPAQSPSRAELEAEWRITSVRWGRTVNIGNYESVRLDVEAAVPTTGDPESTLDELQNWVSDHLPLHEQEYSEMVAKRRVLQDEVLDLQARAEAAQRQWQNIENWLTRNRIQMDWQAAQDVPF
jgi:hypothetical protein